MITIHKQQRNSKWEYETRHIRQYKL